MSWDVVGPRASVPRRAILQFPLALTIAHPLPAALDDSSWHSAAEVLEASAQSGAIDAAAMVVRQGASEQAWFFGDAKSADAIFLLASISKPMTVAALMTLYDAGELRLDDPVAKYLPEIGGGDRRRILLSHLLTHVSGLPDQLPENIDLRSRHAPLSEFVARTFKTPLLFTPGTRYSYSSMGILLAAEVAERISAMPLRKLMLAQVFEPLEMRHSALGLGSWQVDQTMQCQVAQAAEESGAGDPQASDWDWNSSYWRGLGAPWGGVHASARDVARFFTEFLRPSGRLVKKPTAGLMIRNQLGPLMPPRGLGFGLGKRASSQFCSEQAFGHTGSTGTLAWADPASDTVCVILTTLPAGAAAPHPRQRASDRVARAAR